MSPQQAWKQILGLEDVNYVIYRLKKLEVVIPPFMFLLMKKTSK